MEYQKFQKTSANDEKWRDCFLLITITILSASGEVVESKKMAEFFKSWKIRFRKSECWSNLEIEPQSQHLKMNHGSISKADNEKQRDW